MSTSFLPSHFGAPFLTTISATRYDSKGRQLGYDETEVQRLERLAFINASKPRTNSAAQSPNSSGTSSPTRLISEPYGDPIELMANRLAEQFMMFTSSDDSTSSSDDELYVNPPQSRPGVPTRSTFQPGHRRKRSSLSAIPEED